MQKYLMTIALGPVQEFIAAARRTADLTAGSELLVGLARHLAGYLEHQRDAELIFPASARVSAPNKLLFIVQDEPHKIAVDAKEQAHSYLRQQWEQCLQQLGAVQQWIEKDLAKEQLDNFLEFYAAWVPLNGDYPAARQQLERLLAGRKVLRDFKQPQGSQELPKSPLDPSRDTVIKLQDGFRVCEDAQRDARLRLKPRETLDAVALLKRVKGRGFSRKVSSTSEMALRSIWSLAKEKVPNATQQMEKIAHQLGLSETSDLFFPGRWDDLDTDQPLDEATQEQLKQLRKTILESVAVAEESVAYYAVLLADGDQMGKRISELTDIEQHKAFSRQVAEFAQQASQVVEDRYDGFLIYCGGDDALALLPANRALDCADALQRAFREKVPEATLSVGVVLAHHLDDLQRVLEWARQAERAAKSKRNALAVALHPRSGEAITAIVRWEDFSIWRPWIDAFRKGLARGFPYELHALARDYEPIQISSETLKAEAKRVLERKEGKELPICFPDWAVESPTELKEFAQLLIIARFLAEYPEVSR